MTDSRQKYRHHQLLLALVLFMVGQLALALHSHDLSLHSVDAEECVVCLVTTSDNPAPVTKPITLNFSTQNTQPLPALRVLATQPQQILSQPRAPPFS